MQKMQFASRFEVVFITQLMAKPYAKLYMRFLLLVLVRFERKQKIFNTPYVKDFILNLNHDDITVET